MGCSVSTIDNDTDTHAQNTGTPTAITTEQNTPIQHKLVIFGYIRELSVNSNHYQHIPFNIYKICYKFYLMKYEVGDYLDVRDRWGKWEEAIVKVHKHAKDDMPNKSPLLKKAQQKEIDNLEHLEALYVHYTPWDDKWNEWIFVDPGRNICKCRTVCDTDKSKHRIAAHNTQSTFKKSANKSVPVKSFIVDVFHRKCSERVNKPTRHVFHVNKDQKVRDLARMVAIVYDTKSQFVLFYENLNMKVER
eukprot:472310_1